MNMSELEAIGVQVSTDTEGKLRIKAAAGFLTPDLLSAIAEAKPALLAELRGERVNFVNFDSRIPDPATAQQHPGSEVHRAWLLHFLAQEPREVHFTPAMSRSVTTYGMGALGQSAPIRARRAPSIDTISAQGLTSHLSCKLLLTGPLRKPRVKNALVIGPGRAIRRPACRMAHERYAPTQKERRGSVNRPRPDWLDGPFAQWPTQPLWKI